MKEPEHVRVPNHTNPAEGDGRDYLSMFVITHGTSDRPEGSYTVRRHVVKAGRVEIDEEPTGEAMTLEAARGFIPHGKVRLARDQNDDPVIIETWV